jgi:hypothetical protein
MISGPFGISPAAPVWLSGARNRGFAGSPSFSVYIFFLSKESKWFLAGVTNNIVLQ